MQFPLNPAQARAVEHQNGPILILAGAVEQSAAVRLLSRAPTGQITIFALSAHDEPAVTAHQATAARIQQKLRAILLGK